MSGVSYNLEQYVCMKKQCDLYSGLMGNFEFLCLIAVEAPKLRIVSK